MVRKEVIAIILGLIIGFLMCIPIGPINVWVINLMIKKGRSNALALAAGGSLMDFSYFIVIMLGLSLFTLSDATSFSLNIAGVVLIFLLGVKELIVKVEKVDNLKVDNSAKDLIAAFILGVVIYTSNPTLLITMTGLGALVKSLALFPENYINFFLLSTGLAIGSFFWFVFLTYIVEKFQEKIRNEYLAKFNKISGILMILLSIGMAYKLFFHGSLI